MDCKEVNQLISEYLDAELSPEQQKSMEAHLAQCASCQREMAFHRQLQGVLQELGQETSAAPAGFAGQVTAALQRETQKPRRKVAWLPAAWHKGVAAAAVLLLIAGNAVYFNDDFRTALGDRIFGPDEQSVLVSNQPDDPDAAPGEAVTAVIEPVTENQPDDSALTPPESNPPAGNVAGSPANNAPDSAAVNNPPAGSPAQGTPEQEVRVLLANEEWLATSTYLRVTIADLNTGKAQAEALAFGAGATVQAYPAQQEADGKKAVLIKITAPVAQAPALITDLARLGKVQKVQDDRQDLTVSYKETQVYCNDLIGRLAKETNAAERQRLEAQIAAYKQQLAAWDEQVNQQAISLWLESQ